jgi:acetyltransferase-like isoleucine patch superfamily enzyme
MSLLSSWKLKIKRGNTPFYKFLRRLILGFLQSNLPLPRFLKPALRTLYELHFVVIVLFRRMLIYLYREPLFRSRCSSVGKHLQLYTEMPYVDGHPEIYVGDHVVIMGALSILSGRFEDSPILRIEDRVVLGAGVTLSVNREVIIEESVMVANNCRIADNDGHPREAHLRIQNAPLRPRDIRPVRIHRYAWLGNGVQVHKGVTIGEGAIIGANSVVISHIPEYAVAMGNPAEVYFHNVGRPKRLSARVDEEPIPSESAGRSV